MSIKMKGSFGPITGAMNVGDAATSIPTLAGLAWETNLVSGATDGSFSIIDDSTLDLSATVNPVGVRYQSGMVSELITGDFNFSLDITFPNNGGFYTVSALNTSKDYLWTAHGEDYLIQTAAFAAYGGGAVVQRRGYPSYAWNTSALAMPATMSVQRTGGSSMQGIGGNISSGILSYSDPIRLFIGYVQVTANGNSSTQSTITANNVTLS
jgi:hypothetical protein